MKTFTRIFFLVLVMLISSAVVFAQKNVTKTTTLSDVELRMMQESQPVSNYGVGAPTDFLATPITSFPYIQDFEGGWPAQMDDVSGANAEAYVEGTYAYSGNSLFLTAISLTGWGTTPTSYAQAFDPATKATHFGTARMDIVPDGSSGVLTLEYMMAQGFSFNSNYSWFRVLVNGAVIYEMGGDYYWQPAVHYTSPSQYLLYEFDLSAFSGAPFTLELQSSCKYYKDYYNEGDWTGIDDLKIYYQQDPGDLEGYVMNGGGLSIAGASVGIDGWGVVTSDPSGYYFMSTVPGGNNEVWGWKAGYNQVFYTVSVPPLGLAYQDIILTAPTMFISPTFHEYTLNPEEYFTTQTGVLNTGDGVLTYNAEIVYPVTTDVIDEYPRTSMPNPNMEYSPMQRDIEIHNANRATWDLQFNFPTNAHPPANTGAESDGQFIYTTDWQGGNFMKYALDGTLLETFTCGAASAIRDLAYVPSTGYFYGAAANTTIYIMDFTTQTVVGTITAPTACRAIAYNDDNDSFYCNDWSTNITEFDRQTGALIGSFPCGPVGASYYGLAYDNWTDGGPYLWGFAQIGNLGTLVQIHLPDGVETGFVYDIMPIVGAPAGSMAGGLYTTPGLVSGTITIGGCVQNELLFGFELAVGGGGSGDWLTLDWYSGTVPPMGGLVNIPTNFDASGTSPGEVYHADIVFTSDPDVGTTTIPCTMIIAGDPLVPPTNLVVTLANDITGEVYLDWDWVTDLTFDFFIIKRDGSSIGTSTVTNYTDMLPDYGNYCYTVQTSYTEGTSAPAGPECVEWANPTIFISPDDLHGYVWVGETVNVFTTIYNNGIGTLEFTFPDFYVTDLLNDPSVEQNQTGSPYPNESVVEDKEGADVNAGTGYDVILGAGGPDAFGYTWIDSDEAGGPAYDFIDISATGTVVSGLSDDNVVGPFSIGFDFYFYDDMKSQFWVNSNGTIGFTSTYITLTNYAIPTNNTYTDFIAWYWDDLDPGNAATSVYYQTIGDMLVIQFDHYFEYPDGGDWIDAQMQLYANGVIKIMYDYIEPGFDDASMTIGTQSSDNTVGLQVAYNTTYIHDGLALLMTPDIGFITDVVPAHGFVAAGASQDIVITYDSDGFAPGVYTEELECTSNDPANPSVIVDNTMHVYVPGQYEGFVTDCESGLGISGVTVTADVWQTITDPNGFYSLYVDEGTYDVYFDKLGYESVMVPDTFAAAGVVTPIDIVVCEAPYPVPWVTATVNYPDEDYCTVDWGIPEGPYEILYDDGSAEDLFVWNTSGNENAVKFTPAGYPATVIGGRVFVGDGSFPAGSWLGTEFAMLVYDDDGTGGLPGTVLDSIGVMVDNYGWVSFMGLSATVDDGDFYLSMMQLSYAPNAAPIGIDQQAPIAYRSYSRMVEGVWSSSVYQDFMMRAYVDGPQTDMITDAGSQMVYPTKLSAQDAAKQFITANNTGFVTLPGTVKSGTIGNIEGFDNPSEGVDYYVVARMSDFDPVAGAASGTMTVLNNVTALTYQDDDFAALPMGWYAYAVQVVYSSGYVSPWAYSNIVGRDMDAAVTFEVTLCDGNDPEDVEITMAGEDWPFEVYFDITDVTGILTFDQVWKGGYGVEVVKVGYETYAAYYSVTGDMTIEVILSEKKYAPRNLWVDPLTSYAYWEPPIVLALEEDFEGASMPPSGWQMTSNDVGWFLTNDGSSTFFPIPAWTSQYACDNDDLNNGDASIDYLITPPLDLREVDTYHMTFDSYYDGAFSQLAFVEYSYDAGATWDVLYALTPNAGSWAEIDIDLGSLSGLTAPYPVWLAFHADDAGAWASGWAVDNATVANGTIEPQGYHVYLDGAFVTSVDTTFYQYINLTYGQTYTASVAALYSCGLSDQIYYTFTSGYLLPPRNLDGLSFDNAVEVWWNPPEIPATDGSAITTSIVTPGLANVAEIAEASTGTLVTPVGTKPLASTRALLYDNGPLVNSPGTGSGGADESMLQTALGMGTYGFGCQLTAGNSMADDFEVTGNWTITDIEIFAYQTGSGNTSTLTGVYLKIFDGDPSAGGTLIYGDFTTNLMTSTDWTGIYRVLDTGSGDTQRPIMRAVCSTPGLSLSPGTYWLEYTVEGSGSSGPWGPPITINGETTTGNGLQNIAGAYAALTDVGQQGCPFIINGSGGGPGPGGGVPDNLLGYNLYRDMDNIAYIPYNGEDTTYYMDLDLDPMCYDYDVTALYDLTTYGFPGEIGESMYEGTFNVCVEYGWPLPFVEEWNTGSFDPNLWSAGENWVVNGQYGNPMPCSEFKWDPILTDYKSSLVSYPLDGKYHPGTTDPYIDGRIWFEFDLSLNDNSMSGTEFLHVQVWENGDWFEVATFDNTDGNFDWTSYKFDISNKAFGNIFKVRFTAEGENSADILSWYVDNVNIYRECDAPRELTADGIDPFTIELNWTSPATGGGGGGGGGEWVMWDDGVNAGDGIGLTAGGTFSAASHWDPGMISQYDGMYIEKIRFFVYDNAVTATFSLKVWEGASATMIYEEAVSSVVVGAWNEVTLASPVMIDASQELWFGYSTTHPAGENPAGFDFGPGNPGYGDMISTDGSTWDPLSGLIAFDANWNIQAYISDLTDAPSIPMTYVEDMSIYTTPNGSFSESGLGLAPTSVDDYATRALTGYNVYWNDDGAGYEFLEFTTDTFYTHVVDPEFPVGSLQCYYVTAVFEDCETESNEACVMSTGVENPELADGISVYPNPARDILNVTSTSDISHVTIMNYVGQVVYNQKVVEDNDLQLNVAGYETGVYMVKVETSAGVIVKKVTIAH